MNVEAWIRNCDATRCPDENATTTTWKPSRIGSETPWRRKVVRICIKFNQSNPRLSDRHRPKVPQHVQIQIVPKSPYKNQDYSNQMRPSAAVQGPSIVSRLLGEAICTHATAFVSCKYPEITHACLRVCSYALEMRHVKNYDKLSGICRHESCSHP